MVSIISILGEESIIAGYLVNVVGIIYGSIKIRNIFHELHFLKSKYIYYWVITLEIIFLFESCNSFITQIWENFNIEVDADYLFIIFNLIFVNLYKITHEKKLAWLRNLFIYKIKSPLVIEQYMDHLKTLCDHQTERRSLLNLLIVLKSHLKKCSEMKCICRLLIFKYGKLEGRTLKEEIKRVGKHRVWFKIVLFEDEDTIKDILEEHMDDFDEDCYNHAINLNQRILDQIYSNFYFGVIAKQEKEMFQVFVSYMFFCIRQLTNCVGTLIMSYKYLNSFEFRRNQSVYKRAVVKNITDLACYLLDQKFKDSDYFLAKERFFDVYEYKDKQRVVKVLIEEVIKVKYQFFKELSSSRIQFKLLTKWGDFIIRTQRKIDSIFNELFERNMNNSQVLKLFLKYKKQLHLAKDYELRDFYSRFYFVKKLEKKMENSSKQIKKEGRVNLFRNSNMLVFLKIDSKKFTIEKFTENFPVFFGYTKREIKGENINKLMPKQIARHHTTYIKNYLNRKSGTRLKIRHFTTFGLTKSQELKVVSLITKLEFMMTDNIYLCGLLNSDQLNKEKLILTEFNGNVISMNNKAEDLIGRKIYKSSYSLFLAVPSLLKYYFPQVSNHIVHRKLAGKKKKSYWKNNTFVEEKELKNEKKLNVNFEEMANYGKERNKVKQNLEIEGITTSCFFFHLLDMKEVTMDVLNQCGNQVKGGEKWKRIQNKVIKEQIEDSKDVEEPLDFWDTVKKSRNLLMPRLNLYPRYIKILAKIIAKNRKKLEREMQKLMKIQVTLETYTYQRGLVFKLINVSHVERVNNKTQTFFKVAAKNLQADLANLFLVCPDDLNNLYQVLKLEKEMMAIIDQTLDPARHKNKMSQRKGDFVNSDLKFSSNLLTLKKFNTLHEKANSISSNSDFKERSISAASKNFFFVNQPSFMSVNEEASCETKRDYINLDYNFGKTVKKKSTLEKVKTENKEEMGLEKKRSYVRLVTQKKKKNTQAFLEESLNSGSGNQGKKFKHAHTVDARIKKKDESKPQITIILPDVEETPINLRPKHKPKLDYDTQGQEIVKMDDFRFKRKNMKKGSEARAILIAKTFNQFKEANQKQIISHLRLLKTDDEKSKEKLFKKLENSHSQLSKNTKLVKFIKKVKSIIGAQGVKSIASSMEISHGLSDRLSLGEIKRENLKKTTLMKKRVRGKSKLKGGMNSSFASNRDTSLLYTIIKIGIREKFKEISYSNIKIPKFFLLSLFLVVSLSLKFFNNQIVNESGNMVSSVVKFQEIVQPQSFLLKEIEKMELIDHKKLEISEKSEMKIFDLGFMDSMFSRVKQDFSILISDDEYNINNKNLNFYKRGEIMKEEISSMSFMALYSFTIYDYRTLIKFYDVEKDLIEVEGYFDSEASVQNLLQIIDTLMTQNDLNIETFNQYLSDYNMSYLVFALATFLLSFFLCLLLTNFSLNGKKKVNKMDQLLLQIDDSILAIFKNRYNRLASVYIKSKKEKEDILKYAYIKSKSKLNSLGPKTTLRTPKNLNHKNLSQVENDEDSEIVGSLDLDSEKLRQAAFSKNQSRRARYKTFGNEPKKIKGLLIFLLFLTAIMINIPVLIDYLLQASSLDTLNKLKNASNFSSILSSTILTTTALFCARVNSLYQKKELSKIEIKLASDLENKMNLRNELKQSLSVKKSLDELKEVNICSFLNLSQPEFEICKIITDNEQNYDMFLAMNELRNYQRVVISSLEGGNEKELKKEIISTLEFLKKDKLAFFLSKTLVKLNSEISKEVQKNMETQVRLSSIYFVIFPIFLVGYALVLKILFLRIVSWDDVVKLENTFLALPSAIIVNNAGLKNYFRLRHRSGEIY